MLTYFTGERVFMSLLWQSSRFPQTFASQSSFYAALPPAADMFVLQAVTEVYALSPDGRYWTSINTGLNGLLTRLLS